MAIRFQLRRGNTAQNSVFTGSEGELTMDTETGQLKVHDGTTQGGMATVDPLIAFQLPTAENNYTWYRKYASGWVEQGCLHVKDNVAFTFPVPMADTNYSVMAVTKVGTGETKAASVREDLKTTTDCIVYFTSNQYYGYVEVKGMAA